MTSDFLAHGYCGLWFDRIHIMTIEQQCRQQSDLGVGGDWMSEEEIDYNLMGTFPASDPPSWTLGVTPQKTSCEEFE